MKNVHICLSEWKHFVRSPFKIVALLLFVLASVYGLHNGAHLYQKQNAEIQKINQKAQEQKDKMVSYYQKGQKSPDGRPWVDFTRPFWAIWNLPTYAVKNPSSAMVYSIGQAEQYGFYKAISVWASAYDADMAEEISNPERLQIGTLDFAFAVLFLLPLLLLILVYNIKSTESEQGFLPLVYVQTGTKDAWLLARLWFYTGMILLVLLLLMAYGAFLTHVWETEVNAFFEVFAYAVFYVGFWLLIYFFILRNGKSILGNSLQMIGVWLLFALIIPATVHQIVGVLKPVNLMTDWIDIQRDGQEKLFAQPDSVIDDQLFALYPSLKVSKLADDLEKRQLLRNFSSSALAYDMVKGATVQMVAENQAKNALIEQTYWFNPSTFFQNRLNKSAQTHYQDYESYRVRINQLVARSIELMVTDLWNEVTVDEHKYLQYYKQLSK
ncbi:MAG: hypothetical protein Q8J69_10885 [Sphingobacteriaceae bacterium]|nr:hypothetical protein [Sphingobacteriaceae bacterium]